MRNVLSRSCTLFLRRHLLKDQTKQCTTQVYEAETLEDLKDRLLEASAHIQDLDIFKYVDIIVDAAEEVRIGVNSLVRDAS